MSRLRFDGESDVELTQNALVAGFGRRFGELLSVRLSLGAAFGGTLLADGRRYDVKPGWTASGQVSRRWFGEGLKVPFLVTSLSIGASRTTTEEQGGTGETSPLTAFDARLSLTLGVTAFDGVWSPYLGLRVFGGPVGWTQLGRDRTGSDRNKYVVAVGSLFTVAKNTSLLVDGALLGERGISLGVSQSF